MKKENTFSKRLRMVVIVIGILFVSVAIIFFLSLKWKTYSNYTFGFQFMYPSEYEIKEYSFFGGIAVKVVDPDSDVTYLEVQVFEPYELVEMETPDDSHLFTGPYPKKIPANEKNGEETIIKRTLNNISGVEAFGFYEEGTNFFDSFHFKERSYEWRIVLSPIGEERILTMPWDYSGHSFIFDKEIYLKIRNSFVLIESTRL